ncbi:MAG: GNAT family N-acetyltransferase [Acidimicrobiia bacterium]
MTPRLNINGVWPSSITISSGWSRASARPWCDDPNISLIRLIRGGPRFLSEATSHLMGLGSETVLSPPLYRSATSIWRKSGFEERYRLEIMERALALPVADPATPVIGTADPPWPEIVELDHRAFEGIWRMSEAGLKEALDATGAATILLAGDKAIEGYALVGTQWGVSYLHRIAVAPSSQGRGVGAGLVRAAIGWARSTLSRVMVLNVRPANEEARRLYQREGFTDTGRHLHLLGYGA